MRAMRWPAVLLLVACSASRPGARDFAEEEAGLLRRLRGAEGYANLVADGRFYMVEPEALQSEIREFTAALAYAIETQRGSDRGTSFVTGSEGVISQPWLDRGLWVNRVTVEALRTARGTFYWTRVERDGQSGHSITTTRGTAAVDAAWERLAGAARARAAYTDVFGPVGGQELRGERGISWGGTSPR
jgi:hypothetical protein